MVNSHVDGIVTAPDGVLPEPSAAACLARITGILLDRIGYPAIVIDPWRNIRYLNQAGGQMLQAAQVLLSQAGRLVMVSPSDDARLTEGLAQAVVGIGSTIRFLAHDPLDAVQTMLLPLLDADNAWLDSGTPLTALLFGSPRRQTLTVGQLSQLLALSAGEARLVLAISQGETLHQVCRRTGNSIKTLRAQLASVNAKTGVHNQAQLVALVRTLPGGSG